LKNQAQKFVENEKNKKQNSNNEQKGKITNSFNIIDIPNMTKQEIIDNIPEDWEYTENNGFVHIRDKNGKMRIRIDPPDRITKYPHVHVYDSEENLLDKFGNIVNRKSPDGHIPYKAQGGYYAGKNEKSN